MKKRLILITLIVAAVAAVPFFLYAGPGGHGHRGRFGGHGMHDMHDMHGTAFFGHLEHAKSEFERIKLHIGARHARPAPRQ